MDAWILTPGKTVILSLLELKETRTFLTLSGASVFVWFWELKEYLDPEMLMLSVSYTQKADLLENSFINKLNELSKDQLMALEWIILTGGE